MRLRASYAVFATGLACAILFAQVWHYGLLTGDDNFNILYNPYFQPMNVENLLKIWSSFYLKLYIPVTLTAWGLLRHTANVLAIVPEASLFHATNVLLHWLNGLLVFFLLRRVSDTQAISKVSNPHRDLVSLLGALLFICHPLQTGTVAWTTGLKDVLSASFGLLALHALLRADARLLTQLETATLKLHSRGWYLVASAAFMLSVLSKPNMIILPISGAVLSAVMKKDWRGSLVATAPWLLAGVILALCTSGYQAKMTPGTLTPVWVRPFAALDALAFYLEKIVLPYPMPHEYGGRLTEVRRHTAALWISAAGAGLFLGGCWSLRRRIPLFFAGILFTVVALTPVLGFIPYTHQQYCDVANRYMYFPMIGVSLCFISLFQSSTRLSVAAVAIVLGFMVVGYQTVRTFADDDSFYGEMLRYDPGNHFALGNFTVSLLRREKLKQALALALDDLRYNPGAPSSLGHVTEALLALGRGTEAISHIVDYRAKYGDTAELRYDLGHALILGGKWQDGARELLRLERLDAEVTRLPPPGFAAELLEMHHGISGTPEFLMKASNAAPNFVSLKKLLGRVRAK